MSPSEDPFAKERGLFRVLREDGSLLDKSLEPALSDGDLKHLYRTMLLIRALEGRMMLLQRQGRIGFYGVTRGEEGAVVGTAFALRPEDWVFPALRQGGVLLLRGWPLEKYVAHMFGNSLAVEKGRSMPMHFSDRALNHVAWSSSMTTQLPHAVGMAYGAKVKGDKVVAMAYLGDGATSEGDFHHALNFAGVWKVPAVFVCQNNQWAISVPLAKQTVSETIAVKAAAYGMPGVRVDGNDVLACYAAAKEAVDRARGGGGPTLVEALTYRIEGHSSSDDPTRYREPSEVDAWKARDPVERFRRYLEARGLWTREWEEGVRAEHEALVQQAVRKAEAAQSPPLETLVEDVFERPTPQHDEQLAHLRAILRNGTDR
ncbi:MAG TPA: pyruvate dehydrogenase (acetyl-transferring) E1 component subunit alpha [Candidatus Thermoplasmatota archaeon]|nr:pyruvate dehydrogenase (acetyl-transferring) E1 component subunit alpha [Candidatus Thermoplasmatota archaeon]